MNVDKGVLSFNIVLGAIAIGVGWFLDTDLPGSRVWDVVQAAGVYMVVVSSVLFALQIRRDKTRE